MELISPVYFVEKPKFVRVDEWSPKDEDLIFKHTKGAIVVDAISKFYGVPSGDLDYFILSSKRSFKIESVNDLKSISKSWYKNLHKVTFVEDFCE